MSAVEQGPIEGLPGLLPEGERVLWQGQPSARYLARYVFRTRLVAAYFGCFMVARMVVVVGEGEPLPQAVLSGLSLLPIAGLGLGILGLLAWAHARTTYYTITTRRVVLHYGIALTMSVNLPFRAVVSAAFRSRARGEGDLPLHVRGEFGPSYLHLWPHARPGRVTHPEPMLRGVAEVEKVAALLKAALESAEAGATPAEAPPARPETEPTHPATFGRFEPALRGIQTT